MVDFAKWEDVRQRAIDAGHIDPDEVERLREQMAESVIYVDPAIYDWVMEERHGRITSDLDEFFGEGE